MYAHRKDPETTADEMRAIIATDFGIDADLIQGWCIVIAAKLPGDEHIGRITPVTRSSMGDAATAYMLTCAASGMIGQFIDERDEICTCDPDAPKAECGHDGPHDPHDDCDGQIVTE